MIRTLALALVLVGGFALADNPDEVVNHRSQDDLQFEVRMELDLRGEGLEQATIAEVRYNHPTHVHFLGGHIWLQVQAGAEYYLLLPDDMGSRLNGYAQVGIQVDGLYLTPFAWVRVGIIGHEWGGVVAAIGIRGGIDLH